MPDNQSNYIEESTPLFRLLRTEAFRFVIVRHNHYLLVNQLKEDLKLLFPDRPSVTIDGRKTDYRSLVDSYYNAASGFFFIENFDEILANPQIYTGLNQRRDKLASYPIALIVFVSSSTEELFARQIMEKMPDLWSFRSLLLNLKVESTQIIVSENWDQKFVSEQVSTTTTTTTTLSSRTNTVKERELIRLLQRVGEIPNTELSLLITIYQQIARLYKDLSKYDEALEYYKKLEKLQIETGDKFGESVTLNQISQILKVSGNFDTALEYLKRSLANSQDIGDKSGEVSTLNNISQVYNSLGDYKTSLEFLEMSLNIAHEIDDKSGEGATLNNISQIHFGRGDNVTAQKYLGRSIKIAEEIGYKYGESYRLNNLAQTYIADSDYDKALEILKQSLAIAQEIGDKSIEGSILNNISKVYQSKGDYDKALEYLEWSLNITREIGYKQLEGTTLNNISQVYEARGDYDTALVYLKRSLTVRQEIGNKPDLVQSYFNMGQLLLEKGNKKQGNDNLILSNYMARTLGLNRVLTEMAWALDPLIKEMGEEKFMEEGKRLYEQIVINNSTQGQD